MSDADLLAARERDVASRKLAQREFTRPLLVQAGAGTGKTGTLVARVLAWCLGPGWEKGAADHPEDGADAIAERVLRGVVAITFTEAAAAEMDTRIDSGLAMLARGEEPVGFDADAPPERVAALRGALDQLVVQTIHAFCRRLLAAYPIEAGLHPLFEVDADGSAALEATRDAVASRLGEAYASADESALALGARKIGPLEIQQELAALRGNGALAEDFAQDPLSTERIAAWQRRLADAHEALEIAGAGRFAKASRSAKAVAVADALALARARLAKPPRTAADLEGWVGTLAGIWEAAGSRVGDWSKGTFNKTETGVFGERCDAIRTASAQLWPLLKQLEKLDVAALAHLAPLAAEVAGDVERRLRRSGRVGFEGLLSHAAQLLHAHPEVAAQARRGVDQLLVDEFQDTDPRQCAIVAALALDAPAGERPGLFLVGDPKQSIYGWRNADLEAYEGLAERVEAAGGLVASLCVNHRSAPPILDEVERIVAPVMHREPGVQPEFEALAASDRNASDAGFSAGGRAPVEHWVSARIDRDSGDPEPTRASDATAVEAAALARDLRELHDDHDVQWKEVGVLFRSRGDWDVYLGALRERGIPYLVEGDRTYYRRREIVDAASLVACVLDPNDMLALVAMLRSSVAGVPDAAWIPLCADGLKEIAPRLGGGTDAESEARALLERVVARVDAAHPECARVCGWADAAAAALENVAALRRAHAELAGDAFVERLRAAFCFEAVEAARFAGAWRVANLERFFSDLAERLAEGRPVAEVLRAVRAAVAEEETPSAEPIVPATLDAVTVSTLHGAKGLAWTHVYLMQLHKGESKLPRPGATGVVDGTREWRFCGHPTLGFDALEAQREKVAEAERVRMLYVGATRAERRLVIAGLRPEFLGRGGGSPHMELVAQRRPATPDLVALARQARETGGRIEAAETQWVFPELWPEAGKPAEAAAPAAQTPAAAEALTVLPDPSARMARRARIAVTRLAAGAAAAEPDDRAEREPEDEAALRPAGLGACVGTAIHRALERLDLDADPEAEWGRQREWLAGELRRRAPPALADRALADAQACWDAIGAGPLAARLRALAGRIVARELPLLLPLDDDAPADVATGAIDLLYRDADGTLVVADYKTDRALPDAKAVARRERYARQGDLYRRAVAAALGAEPRVELWWLRAGEVEVLRKGGADARGAG